MSTAGHLDGGARICRPLEGDEVRLGLDLEQSGTILLLALLHPVAVDGERGRVDDLPVDLELVGILDELEHVDRLRLVLERAQTRYGQHRERHDAELASRFEGHAQAAHAHIARLERERVAAHADLDGALLCEEGRVERLLGRVALVGLHHEQILYEILGMLGYVVPLGRVERVVALHDHTQHDHLSPVPEGRRAAEQRVEYDATGPHVHLEAVAGHVLVHGALERLGRQVARRAAQVAEAFVGLELDGEAEVGYLHVHVLVEQYVLGLEVAMHYVALVQVEHGLEYAAHHLARLLLRQAHHLGEVVEELAVGAQLHDDEDERVGLERVVDVDDVRVAADEAHDLDLLERGLLEARSVVLDDLDGVLFARRLLHTAAHHAADALAEHVLGLVLRVELARFLSVRQLFVVLHKCHLLSSRLALSTLEKSNARSVVVVSSRVSRCPSAASASLTALCIIISIMCLE